MIFYVKVCLLYLLLIFIGLFNFGIDNVVNKLFLFITISVSKLKNYSKKSIKYLHTSSPTIYYVKLTIVLSKVII